MLDHNKVDAVGEYLRSEFPDSTVEDSYDSDRQAYVFHISNECTTCFTIVSNDFLNGHDPSDIGKALKSFFLSEHLREMAGAGVVVTKTGLELP